ncbi:MAG: hypothetical protein WC716_06735 [Chitinophagaceae bacterium]
MAQVPIDISENTFKVAAFNEEVFYYGFCEGDQLIFNFEERNNKELKELEIAEMPGNSTFMDYKTKAISNKIISVPKTGIYKFRFANSSIGGRICKVKIQRVPGREETKAFNTSVYWREIQDTSYIPIQENFLVSSDTVIEEIYSALPQVSSKNAFNGNKPYQIVDFVLPANTVSWSFYLATGNNGKEEYENAKRKFVETAASAVSSIPGYGALGALALTGFSYFNSVQGEDNVKYWFLSDGNSAALFQAGQQYSHYKSGDVISEASQMKYPLKGKVYLAFYNDNSFEPIKLTIKVAAVIVNQIWDSRVVKRMEIKSRKEAYLNNY